MLTLPVSVELDQHVRGERLYLVMASYFSAKH